jgi:hypothetical protein
VSDEISTQVLNASIDEMTLDLRAFVSAREIIRRRVVEVKDSQNPFTPLPQWAGTDAVLGSLDLAIHAMERTISELNELKRSTSPVFTVINGGADGVKE